MDFITHKSCHVTKLNSLAGPAFCVRSDNSSFLLLIQLTSAGAHEGLKLNIERPAGVTTAGLVTSSEQVTRVTTTQGDAEERLHRELKKKRVL